MLEQFLCSNCFSDDANRSSKSLPVSPSTDAKQLEDDNLEEVMEKVDNIQKKLREKEEELQYLKSLNQTLVVQERRSNDELQVARNELIEGLKDMPKIVYIGVKRIGELQHELVCAHYGKSVFKIRIGILTMSSPSMENLGYAYFVYRYKHSNKLFEKIATWIQEVIDKNDEKLKSLYRVWGRIDINDYNPSGRFVASELWIFSEGRKATLQEGDSYLLKIGNSFL